MKEEFRDKLFELSIDDFRLNLEKLRKLYPVKTICIHGSPLSKWDDRFGPWVRELVWQNVKNVVKRAMLAYWNKR